MKFKKLSLIVFLPVLFGLLVLIMLNVLALHQNKQLLEEFDLLEQRTVAAERLTATILSDFKTQVQEWKNVLLRGRDPESLDKYWQSFVAKEQQIQKNLDQLTTSYALPDSIKADIQAFAQSHQTMANQYREGLAQFSQAGFDPYIGDKAVKGMDREPTAKLKIVEQRIAEHARMQLATLNAEAGASNSSILLLSIVLFLVTVAVVIWVLRLQVIGPAKAVTAAVRDLANCRYDNPIDYQSEHELGELANATRRMQGKMQHSRELLSQAEEEVNHAFASLHDISDVISRGATIQQQTSSQLDDGMQELSRIVSRLMQVTQTISDTTAKATQNVEACFSIFNQANRGFESLVEDTGHTTALIEDLQRKSSNITKVVGVINEIADQTNLLALNAAIEAARAGEHGRGFAVVADEVRSLASKTQGSTQEIKAILQSFEQDSAQAVTAMNNGKQLCVRNAKEANNALARLNELVEDVAGINAVVADLNQASDEQTAVLDRMQRSVQQVLRASEDYMTLAARKDVSDAVKQASTNLHQVVASLTYSQPAG
ncbi:methyl-accepting chemotaxis protein [Aliiglaciecola sp. CAU 1673]|uniref:methyl-accepting chemotaxis protein n=1 Tax=Aliiglaciecola sp. CAU 1673 TaxID=3032595 RepID=UPI0023DC10C9|nr:methyl-accepting chemotaxis protein [Aliiglaciecola sp. CAU 1673]MDF2177143.1 methyl-accepting chemotaxis protein [Aliiglaciecola sp. CAU 1673]